MRAPLLLLLLLLLLLGPTAAAAAVRCERTAWCDHRGRCTEVCARGTVAVEPWLAAAMAWQNRLARTVPLCRAQLLGGHNSGITLADGYGERDPFFTSLLRRLPLGGGTVQTHNQVLSLTDQLRLGVRLIELDTHYVARLGGEGAIKVAHCGGVGSDKGEEEDAPERRDERIPGPDQTTPPITDSPHHPAGSRRGHPGAEPRRGGAARARADVGHAHLRLRGEHGEQQRRGAAED